MKPDISHQQAVWPASSYGIAIHRNWEAMPDKKSSSFPHTDALSPCSIVIVESGSCRLMLDFTVHEVSAPCIVYIAPGQRYQLEEVEPLFLCSVMFNPDIISVELTDLLQAIFAGSPVRRFLDGIRQFTQLIGFMRELQQLHRNSYCVHALRTMLEALLYMVAGQAFPWQHKAQDNRASSIRQQFLDALKKNYKNWKRPSQYASHLGVSISHLNDSIQAETGRSVTTHIQQQLVLEAKRLLYFSKMNVKGISYELGFDDPVYFNKFFKKNTDVTPLQFRRQSLG